MEMNERLRKLRRELDMTQKRFAEKLGIKQNTVATYELGRIVPSDSVIRLICSEFNVREEWLRTGSGDMFSDKGSSLSSELKERFRLSDGAALLIEKFIKLKDSDREAVVNFLIDAAQDLAALDDSSLSPEALYEKSLGVAPRPESTVSNTTDDTENNAKEA